MKAIERIMLEFAVVSTLALALAITANVIGRQFFGWSVPDIVIIVRELMIPTIVFPLAAATASRAHIAVCRSLVAVQVVIEVGSHIRLVQLVHFRPGRLWRCRVIGDAGKGIPEAVDGPSSLRRGPVK